MKSADQILVLSGRRSRRVFLGGIAALGGLMAATSLRADVKRQNMQNVSTKPENMHRTSLHQEIRINADSHRICDIMLDDKKFSAFTGSLATIDPKAGGSFTLFGGLIVGRNVELVPDQLIVQAWRPTHWAPGVYSLAEFTFRPQGSSTLITLDHKGFPEGEFDHLEWGWYNHYWEPLKQFVSLSK